MDEGRRDFLKSIGGGGAILAKEFVFPSRVEAATVNEWVKLKGLVGRGILAGFEHPQVEGRFVERYQSADAGKFRVGVAIGERPELVLIDSNGLPDFSHAPKLDQIQGLEKRPKAAAALAKLFADQKTGTKGQVFVCGDSITETGGGNSIPALLEKTTEKKVFSAAFRGNGIGEHGVNYRDLAQRFGKPDVVVVEFHPSDMIDRGMNSEGMRQADANLFVSGSFLPMRADVYTNQVGDMFKDKFSNTDLLNQYLNDLTQLLTQLKNSGTRALVVGMPIYLSDNGLRQQYVDRTIVPVEEVCSQNGAGFLDLAALEQIKPETQIFHHPDTKGRQEIARAIAMKLTGVDYKAKMARDSMTWNANLTVAMNEIVKI